MSSPQVEAARCQYLAAFLLAQTTWEVFNFYAYYGAMVNIASNLGTLQSDILSGAVSPTLAGIKITGYIAQYVQSVATTVW